MFLRLILFVTFFLSNIGVQPVFVKLFNPIKTPMKFSSLIARYNNGKFFKNCYDSLLAQTYPNWEAVISDDGSTDDSQEVIKHMIGNDDCLRFLPFMPSII